MLKLVGSRTSEDDCGELDTELVPKEDVKRTGRDKRVGLQTNSYGKRIRQPETAEVGWFAISNSQA